MKATKTTYSNGEPKGAWLYNIKKNGERYAKPDFLPLDRNGAHPGRCESPDGKTQPRPSLRDS